MEEVALKKERYILELSVGFLNKEMQRHHKGWPCELRKDYYAGWEKRSRQGEPQKQRPRVTKQFGYRGALGRWRT